MEILNHIVGCGIGCLLAHAVQHGVQHAFHRPSIDEPVTETPKPKQQSRILRPFTRSAKIRPRVNSDSIAFQREADER
jgi:hypothetical protein